MFGCIVTLCYWSCIDMEGNKIPISVEVYEVEAINTKQNLDKAEMVLIALINGECYILDGIAVCETQVAYREEQVLANSSIVSLKLPQLLFESGREASNMRSRPPKNTRSLRFRRLSQTERRLATRCVRWSHLHRSFRICNKMLSGRRKLVSPH